MSDCMTFPDTVEEFMDQYKIIDTEEVYTNGVELVPIFRMKQWFEHSPSVQPEIIRCKDCKWHSKEYYCLTTGKWGFGDNDYCSYAERRTDEPDK